MDRIEINKPAFEDGFGDGFEGFVGLAVEFDFVVQGAEDVGYGFLSLDSRKRKSQASLLCQTDIICLLYTSDAADE